jgi:hypothetical protein
MRRLPTGIFCIFLTRASIFKKRILQERWIAWHRRAESDAVLRTATPGNDGLVNAASTSNFTASEYWMPACAGITSWI